jgi:tetratricopeptide (TPR) repeat protein
MEIIRKSIKEYVAIINKAFGIYSKAIKRRPWLFLSFIVFYLSFFLIYFITPGYGIRETWDHITGREELQERIIELQTEIERKNSIIDTLNKREDALSLIKTIEFDENWKTEENKESIQRLFEYAAFAIEKEDYQYAEDIYIETLQMQETLSAHYNLGRLYYMKGDLRSTKTEWEYVINLDQAGKYPKVRLYLGIINFELGNEDDGNNYLSEYLEILE